MKRTAAILLLVPIATVFLTSCQDKPGPTGPPEEIAPLMEVTAVDGQAFIDAVDRLIEGLFPPPGLLNSAQRRWRNIQRQRSRVLHAAQQQALELISDAVEYLGAGELTDPGLPEAPTALLGVNLLTQYLFDFTGLTDPPVFDEEYFDAQDQGTGWITPEDGGTVETGNGWARLTVDPGATEDNVLVTIELLDEELCGESPPSTAALGCWDFDMHGAEDTGFLRTIEICVADPGTDVLNDQEYYAELRVHEQEDDSPEYHPIPYVDADLDCSEFPVGAEMVASAGPEEGHSLIAALGSRMADFLLPEPLAAFFQEVRRPPRGLGGLAGSFTWYFGAVPEDGADYDPGLVGSGEYADSWVMYAPLEPVSLCNTTGGDGCPGSVNISAVAETGTDVLDPPWSSVYFYYKAHGSDGPITLIGWADEPTDYEDNGISRFWTWDMVLHGEDLPDVGQIDVFAVGLHDPSDTADPYDAGGVFATDLNANITVVSAAGPGPEPVVDCSPTAFGGDFYFRGFYLPSYPAETLDAVEMYFAEFEDGDTRDVSLTIRQDTYDGTELGTSTITINPADNTVPGLSEYTLAHFSFDPIPITLGSLITFELSMDEGGADFYYNVYGGSSCPIVQTNSTDPPLDTYRRDGVAIRIYD
jgi:hypothetical protein